MSTKPKLPELPEAAAWNCQLVMNQSGGVVEGWFTTKAEDDPEDVPAGWDARIERLRVFNEDQLRAYALQAVKEERERCVAQIPTTWLDPLLTGPRGMGQPPFSCPDIERLLKRLASAIRSLPDPD